MRSLLRTSLLTVLVCGSSCSAPNVAVVRSVGGAAPVRAPMEPLSIPWPDGSGALAPPLSPAGRDEPILLALRSAVIQRGARSVGATSLVLKVPLDAGVEAAFKPETRKHGGLWRSEIAAFRLASALGLDHVPPSVPRAAKLSALIASANSTETLRAITAEAIVRSSPNGEVVAGAMIAWLPGLQRLPLEREPMWSAWGEWLGQTPAKTPVRAVSRAVARVAPLAAQIAAMVAFDHVIGNVDRWSGHNVLVDVTGTRLVFLDHNLSFLAKPLDPKHVRRRTQVLLRVERFPRGLIGALRTLTRAELVDALGVDYEERPLLPDAQIDATMVRRDELLAHVDALIARWGSERVLAYE